MIMKNSEESLSGLIKDVLYNCDISDARHAGLYSICELALRLRDLYKWEKNITPWEEGESSEILAWIGEKEQIWEQIADNDFNALNIFDKTYDPFDTQAINTVLADYGLFYGAGYAHALKPAFFLAQIKEKLTIDGALIIILGRESARDLLTLPALYQDNIVLLREESAKLFLWDQIFYIRKSGRGALKFALEYCGLTDQHPENLHHHFETIFEAQKPAYIFHELGEMRDITFDRQIWREIISAFPHTPVELLARSVKDLLADTNPFGTLAHIIRQKTPATLGFYMAFSGGIAKIIFPELNIAFQEFIRTHNWQTIGQAVSEGFAIAKRYADKMTEIYRYGKEKDNLTRAKEQIEKQLMADIL